MNREPHRTAYIENMYKEKNIEGLKQEREHIKRIIQSYTKELLETFSDNKHIEDIIEYEKGTIEQIDLYLKELENEIGINKQ